MPIFSGISNRIAQRGKRAVELSRLAGILHEKERKARRARLQLADTYMELYGASPHEGMAEAVGRLNSAKEEISEIEISLARLRGQRVCIACGEKAASGMHFCPSCGAKLPPEEAGRAEEAPLCPICGREVNPELRFCTYCNRSIDEQEPDEYSDGQAKAIHVCPKCMRLVEEGMDICPECGSPLGEE